MTRPRFQVDITGPSGPDQVSASDLAGLLVRLEKSVIAYARSSGLHLSDQDPSVCLVAVGQGSDRLVFSTAPSIIPAIASISRAIMDDAYENIPFETHSELSELSKTIIAKGWELQFKEDTSYGIAPARIGPEREIRLPTEPPRVKGTTSLLARCLRVGGVRPRAELRLSKGQELLYVDVTEDVARQLGKRLYDQVVLEGKATWRADTWEVVGFTVTSVAEFQKVSPDLAMKQLSEAAKGKWDGIDPVEYVQKIRSDT